MSKEWGIISKEIKNHKDLEVWKKSMDLVSNIYKITESFPNKELYGLTNQIRRSAVSVPSNIAEGAARSSKKEFQITVFSYFLLLITYYLSLCLKRED